MKPFEIAKIVSAVRINLDEIGLNDSNFDGSADETELDTIIRSKISEALLYVYANADAKLLDDDATTNLTGIATSNDFAKGYCSVTIPNDQFLRLRYAVMKSWTHPVDTPIFWPSREYSRLKNTLTTGTYERPEVGILPNSFSTVDGQVNYTIVELYGPQKTGDEYVVSYVKRPDEVKDTDVAVNVPDNLRLALVYYITGLVMVILSDDRAQSMFSQAMGYMGVELKEEGND